MRNIEVVVAPELTTNYNPKGKLVVVIDVFRATTTIVTAMANGISEVKPCLEAKQAISLKQKGYLVGGERNGVKLKEMDLDNSPLSFLNGKYTNQKLAISTTNGTKAVDVSLTAEELIIGSFVNITAVVNYILKSELDVLLVCAGWKGKMSTEDFMFAGNVVSSTLDHFDLTDSSEIASSYYLTHQAKFIDKLNACEHAVRLKNLGKQKDIDFCIQKDIYDVLPIYHKDLMSFIRLNERD